MATTSPAACRARTSWSFCWGITRANTDTAPMPAASACGVRASSSGPVSTGPGGRPAWSAIERAVTGLSPVIITTRTPAPRAVAIAAGTSARSGSARARKPTGSKG